MKLRYFANALLFIGEAFILYLPQHLIWGISLKIFTRMFFIYTVMGEGMWDFVVATIAYSILELFLLLGR